MKQINKSPLDRLKEARSQLIAGSDDETLNVIERKQFKQEVIGLTELIVRITGRLDDDKADQLYANNSKLMTLTADEAERMQTIYAMGPCTRTPIDTALERKGWIEPYDDVPDALEASCAAYGITSRTEVSRECLLYRANGCIDLRWRVADLSLLHELTNEVVRALHAVARDIDECWVSELRETAVVAIQAFNRALRRTEPGLEIPNLPSDLSTLILESIAAGRGNAEQIMSMATTYATWCP